MNVAGLQINYMSELSILMSTTPRLPPALLGRRTSPNLDMATPSHARTRSILAIIIWPREIQY